MFIDAPYLSKGSSTLQNLILLSLTQWLNQDEDQLYDYFGMFSEKNTAEKNFPKFRKMNIVESNFKMPLTNVKQNNAHKQNAIFHTAIIHTNSSVTTV